MASSICSTSIMAVALARLAIAPETPITLAVDITALGARSPREARSMVREAGAIWQGHGVSVTWITTPAGREMPGHADVLTIVDGRCPPDRPCPVPPALRNPSSRLGAVVFLEGHVTAEHTLALSVEAIERLVGTTRWANRRVADWPAAVQAELVGRALGRVLAHEMGHYLLAWRPHTAEGLMRAEFNGEALVDPDRRSFKLSGNLLPRLRARLGQLSAGGATLLH